MKQNVKPSNILEALETIVENVADSKLSDDFLKNNHDVITYASKRLGLTPKQVVFLALFVDRNDEQSISLTKIAQFIGCRPMHLLRMVTEIEGLEKCVISE